MNLPVQVSTTVPIAQKDGGVTSWSRLTHLSTWASYQVSLTMNTTGTAAKVSDRIHHALPAITLFQSPVQSLLVNSGSPDSVSFVLYITEVHARQLTKVGY